MSSLGKRVRVAVWDLPIRMLHWSLALSVLLNLFVFEEGETPHLVAGYVAAASVLLRSIWGFRSRTYPGRWRDWLAPLRGFQSPFRHPPQDYGHNTFSALNALLVWGLVLALGVTGFMMGLDRYFGEEWLENLHHLFSRALEAFLVLHLLGLIHIALTYRRDYSRAMVDGKKDAL